MSKNAYRYKRKERVEVPAGPNKVHYKHYVGRNRHHLIPKSRGGTKALHNMLLMDIERHKYWHEVFGTLTLDEVIELLLRVKRAKDRQVA